MAYRWLSSSYPSYDALPCKGSLASQRHASRTSCHWAQAWDTAGYGKKRHSKLELGVGRSWS